VAKGKKVTFKFKGKKYTAKTKAPYGTAQTEYGKEPVLGVFEFFLANLFNYEIHSNNECCKYNKRKNMLHISYLLC
jgi:hypothetical protein